MKTTIYQQAKQLFRLCAYTLLPLAGGALVGVSCSDTWDDHYDAVQTGNGSSIWQSVQQDAQLGNFARVIQETGYDKMLDGSQVFTVFAPTNDAFTSAEAEAVIALYKKDKEDGVKDKDNRAIKQFVQNHIALYNYSVSQSSSDSIVMMNGKYLVLTPAKLAGSSVIDKNQLTTNGVLFKLGDKVEYFYNVFEYLSADSDIDSVGRFISTYNEYEFDASKSVPGGIIDGRTWYLDSITNLQNELFDKIGRISSEDSTYWMVVPSNRVWNEMVAEFTPYFNYDERVEKRDSLQWAETRMAIVTGTVFSRTKNARQAVAGGEWTWIRDSAMSVNAYNYNQRQYAWGRSDMTYYQYAKPFDEGGVFSGTTNVQCSNGQVMKIDGWNIDKKQTFYREILVEGESRNYLEGVDESTTDDPSFTSVSNSNPYYGKVSNNRFVLVSPTGQSAAEVRFKLPNILSNIGYDIYVVFVPAIAGDTLSTDTVPVKFRAEYTYHQVDGTYPKDYTKLYVPGTTTTQDFVTDCHKIDTVALGKNIVFPTCSYGLRDPQVLLKLKTSLRNADRTNHTHTANMRIDCILVKPHEE